MNIARMLYPVEVLGPGKRIGLWLCGCSRRCPGCANPDLWTARTEYEVAMEDVLSLVRRVSEAHAVDGFTVSGGEPFDQAEELAELLPRLRKVAADVLVYTGYTLEELHARHDAATEEALRHVSVLIDGEYVESLNSGARLRGSENQRIHVLDEGVRGLYEDCLREGVNRVQQFEGRDGVISVGIHPKGFADLVKVRLRGDWL